MCQKLFFLVSVVATVAALVIGGNVGAETIGLWTFEEFSIGSQIPLGAGTVPDSSSHGRHMDNLGPAGGNNVVAGRDPGSKAAMFTGGNNDLFSYNPGGGTDPFNFGTGDFTIEAIYLMQGSAITGSSTLRSNGVVGKGGQLHINAIAWAAGDNRSPNTAEMFAGTYDGGWRKGENIVKAEQHNTPNGWHHMAMVRSGNQVHTYVDGVPTTMGYTGASPHDVNNTFIIDSADQLLIGARQGSGSGENVEGARLLLGPIDAVAVSDVALAPGAFVLSPTEIPEPSVMTLLTLGLLGILSRRRRN